MRCVISLFYFSWQDIPDCFGRAVEELDADGVELSLHPSFRRDHLTHVDIPLAAEAARTGPATATTHLWENLAAEDPQATAESLVRWIETFRDVGIAEAVIHGGSDPDRRTGLRRAIDALTRAMPEYEAAGVKLYLENHYAHDYRDCHEILYEPWEFREVFQAVGSEALGFCLDTGHAHMTHNWRLLLEDLGGDLGYLHVADNLGRDDDHLPYGNGTVPFEEILPALAEAGFDGTACFETPVDEAPERLAEGLAAVRAIAPPRAEPEAENA